MCPKLSFGMISVSLGEHQMMFALCQLAVFLFFIVFKPVLLVLVLIYLYHAGLSAKILLRNISKNALSKYYSICVLLS